MNPSLFGTRLVTASITLALAAAIGMSSQPLLAADAQQPAPTTQRARLNPQALQQEIAAQPEGIHTLSDGKICIKSGRGLALVHADGRGCGTGCNPPAVPPAFVDNELMAGVFFALFMNPKEAANIGIGPDQATKIKDAYNYMDHQGTHPEPVRKLYEQYTKAPEGKAKADAEKALMDKVRAVGQAYVDVEVKKYKDIKALLTPSQATQIRAMGAKMMHPFETPVA